MGEPETLPGPEPQADHTPPTNPANLTATAVGVGRIDLAWTASTDNISVAGYNVERCSGAGCSNFAQIGTPLANSYSDTGLTGHTSYSYRVRAKDTAGNLSLGYSNVVTLALPDQVAPAAPKSLSVVIGGVGVLNLSWIASTDDVGVANYSVERCTGPSCSDFVQIGTSTTASYSDTGLLDSTSYSYRVMAADAAGNHSPYSNVATGNVGDQLAPTAPSNLKATPVNVDQIDLAWNAASDNIGVINYHVERSSGTTGAPFDQVGTTGGGTHFSSTGLTTHRYRVRRRMPPVTSVPIPRSSQPTTPYRLRVRRAHRPLRGRTTSAPARRTGSLPCFARARAAPLQHAAGHLEYAAADLGAGALWHAATNDAIPDDVG